MQLETVIDCRWGKKCQYIGDDGKIHQCNAYMTVKGVNPQTGESMDRQECVDTLLPLLLIENAMTNRGQTAALESFRNAVISQSNRLQHGN